MKQYEEFAITNNIEMAKILVSHGNYGQALKLLKEEKHRNKDFYMFRSNIYYKKNEFYLCLKDLKHALYYDEVDSDSLDSQEINELEEKEADVKEKLIEKNSEINNINSTSNLQIYQLMAKCYIFMFDYFNAEKVYNKCIEISPDNEVNKELNILLNMKLKELKENSSKYTIYPEYILFMKTIYAKGAYINNLEIKFEDNSNRAVYSNEFIEKDDILLRIPIDLLITLEIAQCSPVGQYFTPELKKKINSPNHSLLSSYLLSELDKGNDSKWVFYFNILPQSFENFPIFFKDNEINLLKETLFLQTLKNKKKEMKEDYNILCKEIPYYSNWSYEKFCKVRMIISSRIFGVTIKGVKTDILAPFADMLNHKRPRQSYWSYEDKYQSFIFKSLENIESGCQVFDSYGSKCNSRFFLYYGFTLENNEDNEYKLSVSLNESFPNYQNKLRFLGNNSTKKFTINKDLYCANSRAFFTFIRFLCYEGNLQYIVAGFNRNDLPPLSLQNEIYTLNTIKDIITDIQNQFTSSYEEDVEFLEKNKLTFNERNCYIMRISEKGILKFYLDTCNFCLNTIQGGKAQIEKFFRDNNGNERGIKLSNYMKNVYNVC